MAIHSWGICMYGICEDDLKKECYKNEETGESGFWGIFNDHYDGDRAVVIDIGGKKCVPLFFEPTQDSNYLGFYASYPWELKQNGYDKLTEEDVKTAIVMFLTKFGYDAEEVRSHIDEISDYNCC